MIFRLIIICLWTCLVTIGAAYVAFYYRIRPTQDVITPNELHPVTHDLKPITVPVIREGQVRGYISADLTIIAEGNENKQHIPDIDGYVLDESYRYIYSESSIEFEAIRKTDLAQLTSNIKSRVNARLGRQALQDVLVRGFHYIPRDQLSK